MTDFGPKLGWVFEVWPKWGYRSIIVGQLVGDSGAIAAVARSAGGEQRQLSGNLAISAMLGLPREPVVKM